MRALYNPENHPECPPQGPKMHPECSPRTPQEAQNAPREASKTSKIINFKFNKLIYKYIKNRESLIGLVLIMDIRYPMKNNDINIIVFNFR